MQSHEKVLQGLDEGQREAAMALRGPVAILAGAGTGKTRTITHRIAYGVHTGTYDPNMVMAVSFTKKAAGELQERLHNLDVVGVQTRTFHSAALQQLSYFWPQTVGGDAPKILNSKVQVISHVLAQIGLQKNNEALRDLAAEIEWRKVSLLKLDKYAQMQESRPAVAGLTHDQIIDVMQKYEDLKQERRQIDFEDVLLLLTGMLQEEPRVADTVRQRYRFFNVDEFQDVSPVQNELLKAWLGDRSDLCVVGDVSQTIYSFAGASNDYLQNFKFDYNGAREIKLEENYRSVPEILSLANNLMKDKRGALELRATRKGGATLPSFEWFETEEIESRAIALEIARKIGAGIAPSDIAVLFRSHAYSLRLEEALRQQGIIFRIQAGTRYFDRVEVKRAVMEIRGQAMAHDSRPVFQVVSDVIRGAGWTSSPPEGGTNEREKWEALGALLTLVDEYPKNMSIQDFSAELIRRSKIEHEPTVQSVTLSTIHAAKGLEWPIVWVAGAAEGSLPITYAKTETMVEEERRLFYVAITRARDEIYFSGAGRGNKQPSRFLFEAKIPHLG